jgi:hypothetical protein
MKKKTYQHIQTTLSQTKTGYFIEICLFLFVMLALVFPSILNDKPLILPVKPKGLLDTFFFFFRVLILAMFEELIYRVYIPFQMRRFYYLKNRQDDKPIIKQSIIISNIIFALAHSYLGFYNIIFAFIGGAGFSLIYEIIKNKITVYFAFFTISLVHFFYNAITFWFLLYSK